MGFSCGGKPAQAPFHDPDGGIARQSSDLRSGSGFHFDGKDQAASSAAGKFIVIHPGQPPQPSARLGKLYLDDAVRVRAKPQRMHFSLKPKRAFLNRTIPLEAAVSLLDHSNRRDGFPRSSLPQRIQRA